MYGIWWDGLAFSDVADRLTMGPMKVTAALVRSMWELFEHPLILAPAGRRSFSAADALPSSGALLHAPRASCLRPGCPGGSPSLSGAPLKADARPTRALGASHQQCAGAESRHFISR